ncbi:MAG: hypothetical protein ACYS8Z_01510 [Planctomycetota bacterium]|jgi:hypothetical protein
MPFTPYHFGPSGFIALALRKWIDIPVFVLANVVVDVEVLVIAYFHLGRPIHRYCHTLAIGAVVGAVWGILAYLLLRRLFQLIMNLLAIKYKPGLVKMVVSGALGAALHALIDGLYHFDARVFWPSKSRYLWKTALRYGAREKVETVCLYFFVAAAVLYVQAVISYRKSARIKNAEKKER